MQIHKWARLKAAIAGFAFAASTAQAAELPVHCFNKTSETRCDAGRCTTITEGFTPVQLDLDRDGISLCAYSGCWKGSVDFVHTEDQLSFIRAKLLDAPQANAPADHVTIIYDRKHSYAQASFSDFALTMECSQ